jgi:hypothetical protein
VRDQLVDFLERALVKQELDSFARGELALLMLARAAVRSSALLGSRVAAA